MRYRHSIFIFQMCLSYFYVSCKLWKPSHFSASIRRLWYIKYLECLQMSHVFLHYDFKMIHRMRYIIIVRVTSTNFYITGDIQQTASLKPETMYVPSLKDAFQATLTILASFTKRLTYMYDLQLVSIRLIVPKHPGRTLTFKIQPTYEFNNVRTHNAANSAHH